MSTYMPHNQRSLSDQNFFNPSSDSESNQYNLFFYLNISNQEFIIREERRVSNYHNTLYKHIA